MLSSTGPLSPPVLWGQHDHPVYLDEGFRGKQCSHPFLSKSPFTSLVTLLVFLFYLILFIYLFQIIYLFIFIF